MMLLTAAAQSTHSQNQGLSQEHPRLNTIRDRCWAVQMILLAQHMLFTVAFALVPGTAVLPNST
jgi:hypothetical protein